MGALRAASGRPSVLAATTTAVYLRFAGLRCNPLLLRAAPVRFRSSANDAQSRRKNASLVIFDKDGTLICFNTMWSPHVKRIGLSLESMSGMAIKEKIYHTLGFCHRTERFLPDSLFSHATEHVIKEKLHHLLVSEGMSPAIASRLLDEHCPQRHDDVSERTLRAIGDVRSLFAFLRKNDVKIAVCTADSREGTVSTLHQLNLLHHVDKVVCGDDPTSIPKPSPHNALMICDALGVHPSQAAMVGDTVADVAMAREAKLGLSIGVLSGVAPREHLVPYCDYIVENVTEALPCILPELSREDYRNFCDNLPSHAAGERQPSLVVDVQGDDQKVLDVLWQSWLEVALFRLEAMTGVAIKCAELQDIVDGAKDFFIGSKLSDRLKAILQERGVSEANAGAALSQVLQLHADAAADALSHGDRSKDTAAEAAREELLVARLRSLVDQLQLHGVTISVRRTASGGSRESAQAAATSSAIKRSGRAISGSAGPAIPSSRTGSSRPSDAAAAALPATARLPATAPPTAAPSTSVPGNHRSGIGGSVGGVFGGQPITRSFSTAAAHTERCDYVVVGAGSAGCVLAGRLTEDSERRVVLLEAGPPDGGSLLLSWKIHMPAALMYNLCDDKYNWYYHTVPQRHMDNRVMYWPRGRVWGGSSALNAMVYTRGHPHDYDRWQAEGARGWSYADVLPYFRKSQQHELGADIYRGDSGPQYVSRGKTEHELHRAFVAAAQEAGYPFTDDLNGFQQEGVGWYDLTIKDGVRWSTSQAYLRPALSRSNLKVQSNALCTRVLVEGGRAIGVEYERGGQMYRVLASSEVILCGGAINSPQLLMLSGIGPADHLRNIGIVPLVDLPGVGQNLQDHLEVYVQHVCKKPVTLYSAQWKFPHNMIRIGLQWFASRTGYGATSHLESGAFVRSSAAVAHPDVQLHFLPSTVEDHGRLVGPCHAYQVHVGTQRAESRGSIRLSSRNPKQHPLIDPNYLSTQRDVDDMVACVRLAREILGQPAFDPYREKELQPGNGVRAHDEIASFVRRRGDSAYHPSCTCKMGDTEHDELAVVNPSAEVRGVRGLRVVDASIMPSVPSSNLNAIVIMMAEKCADLIRGRKPLPKADAAVWTPRHPERQRDGQPLRPLSAEA